MELTYHGGNCIKIAVKKDTIIVDGNLSMLGMKDVTAKDAVYIATQPEFNPIVEGAVMIDGPGEYEIRGISLKGVAAQRMLDDTGVKKSTIYKIVADTTSVAVIGHIAESLSEGDLEAIGMVDIAIVPVGGNGYTLDGHQAAKIIKQLGPKVVIPTHYADPASKYEVPQDSLDDFVKEMSAEHEQVPIYKLKGGVMPASLTIMEITRS